MVHGALRTIIIHIKKQMGASNTPRPGKYGHRIVHNISKCISPMKLFYFVSGLTEISKMIDLSTSHLWFKMLAWHLQASCHYMKQRQMHMWITWPQWVNELSALLKTEYQWRGEYARRGWLGAADLHTINVVDADRPNKAHLDIPYRIYLLNDVFGRNKSINAMGVATV